MRADDLARIHAAANDTDRAWTTGEFSALLDMPNVFCTEVEDGFALVRVILDEAELLTIAVHPEGQGRGTGRALMRNWHQLAAARGAARAFLEVAADNLPALSLYKTSGYALDGRRAGYYRRPGAAPVDALLMSRALTRG
jgi:ribosomal-protein-alanine N-acetyltransferase